ncbi:MAG: R3H domain protein [Candidatus Yanofskybacteria bacterium GW2011_GWF1_44_227]|uniref:R3H domain protein n=1 Tax=Candidatus Yanofskybacteria bacterium GW2011_GWE2_40_11 TaxID=1619033 RepID=A0A0G0QKL9_9BACT|nr:MAG: R3H domain protein [Candidatus Yanofskybacteria bacterium GW2011_GWE1_40_10]KKR40643.1 MAG: R3H domain protein [Candidatus Yanofskybacteria bacterium GW2011_GWE2_40_11]KKT15796.1 MAG: R3H domain protein [Candidatus Yanofskybacteria bacterium GW2011_GWF2_43_596]KKT53486.1 MAG: R3H domain protein [Candidatus Yanofskybacteria bacterium GW2011_GWF1_44_227]OGN35892.1 MAG: hypothetical protein A2241_03900 [Candidatus Yanofskybacteria bacterium RIFOXYA2_FULL_45_28]OGN36621.1 MAG: hypothetical
MEDYIKNKDKIKEAIKRIVSYMNIECQVEIDKEVGGNSKTVLVSIYTPDNAKFLIGRDGQNLKALEYVVRNMFAKDVGSDVSLAVDVNDYKKSKANYVIDLARQAVMRVRNIQKAEALQPMSSYERRLVHMELASYPDIATESIGEEPQRRIVIKPYSI